MAECSLSSSSRIVWSKYLESCMWKLVPKFFGSWFALFGNGRERAAAARVRLGLGSANASTPFEMLNSVLFVSFGFFLLKFFSNPLWESEKLYTVLLVLLRSWTVSEISWILEVVLDIGFQAVSCWLLLIILLVILGSVCILTLIHRIQ